MLNILWEKLVRSADSIGANIAEGFGRYHYKENKNFCYFSRGFLIETKGWVTKAKIRKLISEDQYTEHLGKLSTIHLKLNGYIKYIGSKTEPGKPNNQLPPPQMTNDN